MPIARLAILGALMERPMHGYELKKYFEETHGVFWMINYGTIYPTLKRLEKEGLVKGKVEPTGRVRGRITYNITEKGRCRFLEILQARLSKEAFVRDEFTLHLFFMDYLDKGAVTEIIKEKIKGNQGVLEHIKEHEPRLEKELPRFRFETLRRGRMHIETELSWLKKVLKEVKR
jgi:DNA-binding PadR family transcriptional regulator